MQKIENNIRLTRKRQWGAESRTLPLSNMHEQPTTGKMMMSRVAIVLTVVFWIVYVTLTIIRQFFDGPHSFQFTMQAISYLIVVTFLTFSALMYLVARQGAFQRFAKHVRVPRAELERHFSDSQPSITVLVPSYSEEPDVVRKTLMSAALQEYPKKRVVLLLDDKPNPTNPEVAKRLDATRALTTEIGQLFLEPQKKLNAALSTFEGERTRNVTASPKQVEDLIENYAWTVDWLNNLAERELIEDHVDVFFVEQVLRGLAKELEMTKKALVSSLEEGARLPNDRIRQLYCRLTWLFNSELAVFERKKYVSLSHEANKAMNLNSYIGLMGGNYEIKQTPDGPALIKVTNHRKSDIAIPDSDFLLTLDADSILLRDYCLRLVYFLQQPGNSKVAVVQTPY